MIYIDRIYGRVNIEEGVLLDLISSAALERLHGVMQHGISGLIGVTRGTTRFEHSLGVMILTRNLGASLAEQIAALLHDVSHTAFSHVIDYVFNDHDEQAYHEEHKEAFIGRSDLPAILLRRGFDWRDFVLEERFTLLEQPPPAICADRLDYFLRDALDLGLAKWRDVENTLAHLVVHQDRIVSDDLENARWMGYTFIKADQASWANFREVGLYELTADSIRYALEHEILSEDDLWETDEAVWSKLHTSGDPELGEKLRLISPRTRFEWDEENPDFNVSTKLRSIDPDILVDGELYPLSALDPDFASHRDKYLEEKSGKWPIKVVR
jgi:HD superfamily phosphohydrolase